VRGSLLAELLVLRKRSSTWILLGIWTALLAFFAYVVPYVTYRNDPFGPEAVSLEELLPERFVGTVIGGFPFFGGVFALMLGVLALGSEYSWGTLRALFTQRPGRLSIFAAKLVAVAAGLVPFVAVAFAVGVLSSSLIALAEGEDMAWPSAWLIVRALAAGWLVLAVWAALGIMLAALSRGTALAIGMGILYALVVEGLISAFADQVSFLEPLVEFFLRANAYSLVKGVGLSVEGAAGDGPGAFAGPYVAAEQALFVLLAYVGGLVAVSGLLLRRRDVT
jgi:ABC-2 type transport system permease protein